MKENETWAVCVHMDNRGDALHCWCQHKEMANRLAAEYNKKYNTNKYFATIVEMFDTRDSF